MNERNLMVQIQMALSKEGCRLFRNNIGVLRDRKGQYVRYGLCNPGGSDLIGWAPDARFMAVEVKTKTGRITPEQESFITAVRNVGGIAFVARSVEESVKWFREQSKNDNCVL